MTLLQLPVNKKYIWLLMIQLLVCRAAIAQNWSTYVETSAIKQSGITGDSQIAGLSLTQKQTIRQYYDGLGRPIQTIALQASPLQKDIIQPTTYDNLGRQTTDYLPYTDPNTNVSGDLSGNFRSGVIAAQASFYNNTSQYLVANDSAPYNQQVFENSPLQRLLQSGMTGSGFQPATGQKYKTVIYRSNNSSDGNILLWNPDGTYTSGNYYGPNMLSVTDGKDEDGVETLMFSDNEGRSILKRQVISTGNLDTYYLYNNAGMVSYVIPPLAVTQLAAKSYNLTAAPLSNMIFKMVYDTLGRVVEKTVPAKGTMSVVYDPVNRPVLMQDAYLASQNKWNYIKYDAEGRAISQGIYTDATPAHIGRINMQTYVNSLNYSTSWYESRTSVLTNGGYYTNNVFPTGASGTLTPLTYAYFDNYNMGSTVYSYAVQGLTNEASQTPSAVRNMPTMISTATVGSGVSAGTWLTKVVFYDKRGNVIQTQSNNHIYSAGAGVLTDISTIVPDFTGTPQITLVSKTTSATVTIKVQTSFVYDQVNRVTSVSQAYNGGTSTQVAAYSYNELGQIIKKSLGYVSPTSWLQNVDFRYNIRGQLLSINNSKLNNDAGVTNNDTNDVFGMQLFYDHQDSSLPNTPSYDGKLSAVEWMSRDGNGTASAERAYAYTYDNVNRYTGETYAERAATGSFTNNLHGFDESGFNYDAGGNIRNLNRNSSAPGTNSNTQIDKLTYTYDINNPYRLLTVKDSSAVAGTTNDGGFVNYMHNVTGNYLYNANGNLTADPYKGLGITYNDLNHTDKITLSYNATNRWIDYTYDATGNLIRKRQYDNGTLGTTTDYVDGFVYTNGVIAYFPMPEGRVLNTGTGTTITPKQEFVITDQQGNARVSFQNNGSGIAVVQQENSYYGFGMVLANSPVATLPGKINKQLYNGGSEWQNDYGNLPDYYQTFYRNYDAALGRFVAVDPDAESAADMTTYQYAGNNPIIANDPMGSEVDPIDHVNYDIYGNEIPYNQAKKYIDGASSDWFQQWANSTASGSDIVNSGDGMSNSSRSAADASRSGNNIYTAANGNNPSSGLSLPMLKNYLQNGVDMGSIKNGSFYYQTSTTYTTTESSDGTGYDILNSKVNLYDSANQGVFYPDGSAFFKNETQAYNYMWQNSNYGKSNTIENFAYITKNGVAVLPTHGNGYQNTANSAYWYQAYKTRGQGSTFAVDFNGTWIYPIASIHTHPDSGYGANESPDGGDMAAFRSMGIPGFVLGPNNFYGAGMSDLRSNSYNTYPAQNLLNGSILIIPNIGLFK